MGLKRIRSIGAAVAMAIGAVALMSCSEEAPAPEAEQAVVAPKPPPRDAPGLPPLFPPGKEYPVNDISINEYFDKYGSGKALDVESKKIREDVSEQVVAQMVGTEVTWDGFVQRIADAPSGRVMLILAMSDGPAGLNTAMVMFSAAEYDHLHSLQKGDHVRVVGVFDKIVTMFPSLRGKSVESIESREG